MATLILALVGSIGAVSTNNDDKTFMNELSPVTKLFHRPYVRAMFAFILISDGNGLQYECVLVRISYFLSLISFSVFPSIHRKINIDESPSRMSLSSRTEKPGSNTYGRNRWDPAKFRFIPEAVFPSKFFSHFPMISDRFLPELTGIHRKKIQQISGWNTTSTSGYFRCFPAGSGDFHASFPAGSCRIRMLESLTRESLFSSLIEY